MTYSSLATETKSTTKYSKDAENKVMFVVHHCASTSLSTCIAELITNNNQKSVNYLIKDSTIIASVPEEYRAWTSGNKAIDKKAITFECVNESAGPQWRVSNATFNSLVALIAEIADRRGLSKLNRTQGNGGVVGHREVSLTATACPGEYLWHKMDELVSAAQAGRKGSSSTPIVNAPAFPLPMGWYFGPKEGPKESVSGYYSYRASLRLWQQQAQKRGYYTGQIDGLYGPLTKAAAIKAQKEYKLTQDGLIGAKTWPVVWK